MKLPYFLRVFLFIVKTHATFYKILLNLNLMFIANSILYWIFYAILFCYLLSTSSNLWNYWYFFNVRLNITLKNVAKNYRGKAINIIIYTHNSYNNFETEFKTLLYLCWYMVYKTQQEKKKLMGNGNFMLKGIIERQGVMLCGQLKIIFLEHIRNLYIEALISFNYIN